MRGDSTRWLVVKGRQNKLTDYIPRRPSDVRILPGGLASNPEGKKRKVTAAGEGEQLVICQRADIAARRSDPRLGRVSLQVPITRSAVSQTGPSSLLPVPRACKVGNP